MEGNEKTSGSAAPVLSDWEEFAAIACGSEALGAGRAIHRVREILSNIPGGDQ